MHVEAFAGLIGFALVLWLAVAGIRKPSPTYLEVEGESLVLRITGKDRLNALSRGMTIPLDCIKGITVAQADKVPRQGMRWPGTEVPGVIRAGSYGMGDRRDFWLVRKAPELLVIELQPGEPYRRIVLELPDVREHALRIRPSTGVYTGPLIA